MSYQLCSLQIFLCDSNSEKNLEYANTERRNVLLVSATQLEGHLCFMIQSFAAEICPRNLHHLGTMDEKCNAIPLFSSYGLTAHTNNTWVKRMDQGLRHRVCRRVSDGVLIGP